MAASVTRRTTTLQKVARILGSGYIQLSRLESARITKYATHSSGRKNVQIPLAVDLVRSDESDDTIT